MRFERILTLMLLLLLLLMMMMQMTIDAGILTAVRRRQIL